MKIVGIYGFTMAEDSFFEFFKSILPCYNPYQHIRQGNAAVMLIRNLKAGWSVTQISGISSGLLFWKGGWL